MLPKQCIEDIQKYKIECRQEKREEELRERFQEIKEEEFKALTRKELEAELWTWMKRSDYRVEMVE